MLSRRKAAEITAQITERCMRASASGAEDSGLIPGRVKPMTLKLVFTASRKKHLAGLPHLGVIDRWPATPKRARYSAFIIFSR